MGDYDLEQKVLKLEAANALLRAQIGKGNMTSKDISLTPSDVSHQTTPRIAKPPNYSDGDSEEDDDFDEPRPPPDEHPITKTSLDESEPAKQDDADDEGVENKDVKKVSSGVDNAVDLDNATVHDGGEKETPEPAKKPDEEEEIEEGEKNGAEGGKKGATKEGDKSRDHQESWVLLNQDGEKRKDMSDGNFDIDDVTELVDRVESAVEATSKDEPDAFDALVATLRVFLPLVLFMADEHKMLRDNKKDLLLRNRSLMKANQQARIEAEKRFIVETKSVGTSAKADNNESTTNDVSCKENNHVGKDQNKQLEMEAMKRETKKLRLQCKELQHVNLSWEKYSQKKSSRYETEAKKMSMKLASSEEKVRKLEKRLEDKFRQYDQTLIEIKKSEERQKGISAQYKKDRDSVRAKYDEMKRHVKEQDEEIKRLNEVIVHKGTAKVYMKPAAFVVTQQARVIDDKYINVARNKTDRNEKQGAATAAALVATAVEPPVNREKSKAKDGKPQKTKPVSPPLSPRGPPGYGKESNPMSLTRDELKDQVVLFKEQIDVFRADFNQERRDREKAVGQVDSLKKELEKTKKRVKEMQRHRMQKEHDLYVAARVGGQMHYLPEDTQEMRMREIKQQTRGKGKYPAYGRNYAEANLDATEGDFDLPEEHFYAEIN